MRRPVSVLMSLLALLTVGVIAWLFIPVQLLPSGFSAPVMWVGIPALPAAPADHERTIAEPVEEALATLPDLEYVRTIVRSDRVVFRVEMRAEADPDGMYAQLQDRLDRVRPRLPEGTRQASIWRHDPNDDPVMIVGVIHPPEARDPHQVLSEFLARPVERLPGISAVEIEGLEPTQVRIEVDDGAARAAGIDNASIVRSLQADGFAMALGVVEEAGRRVLVRALSRFEDLEELRAVPVAEGVRLGDVAKVSFGTDPDVEIHRIDGLPAATLMIFKEATANTVETSLAVQKALDEALARPALAGYQTRVFFDQGHYISDSIDQLRDSALEGGLLAVVVLFLFLRTVAMTLLVTLAIPLCMLVTVAVLYFSHDSLNVLSMMGLMLAVGMVVDNAIVVLENIDRFRREGMTPARAATAGAHEVALAITLSTLTSVVVFLPMILLGDNPALAFYLGKIGYPVCFALIASLFVALVYIPAGGARLAAPLRPRKSGGRTERAYGGALAWALRHRTPATLGVVLFLASAAFPLQGVRRVDRIEGGLDAVRINVYGPANGTLEELDATTRQLERALLEKRDALDLRAVGVHDGRSRNHLIVRAFFKPMSERRLKKEDAITGIRALLPKRPGYEISLRWTGGKARSGEEGGFQLFLTGRDTEVATELAAEVAQDLERLPGVHEARLAEATEGSELRFEVDRDRADRAGLSALAIGGTIDYSLRGRRLADFQTGDRELEVRVELAPDRRTDADQLEQLSVAGGDRDTAALGQLTSRLQAPGYGQIEREDRQAHVAIQVTGDEARLFSILDAAAARIRLPAGHSLALGERFEERDRNEESGLFAIGVAIVLVFFLMGVLFESLLLPFSILLSIPLAFAGVFWTLWLTDTPIDIMAIIGFIILVGVVVNNGIVLIDQVQHRRASGEPRDVALVEAARQRVRPVLMTALTTIVGLIPMALGNASILGLEYQPLGRVVIGGLVTGTVLTLFAVPLLYSLMDSLSSLPRRVGLLGRSIVKRGGIS